MTVIKMIRMNKLLLNVTFFQSCALIKCPMCLKRDQVTPYYIKRALVPVLTYASHHF